MVLQDAVEMTLPEYLATELEAEEMHEYYEGKVVVKERGVSIKHAGILTDLVAKIGNFLHGKNYSVYSFDLRLAAPGDLAYTYPDVMVVCGNTLTKEGVFDSVTNPCMIIEVMTATTRDKDMGYKFDYYKQIPSFKEYIVVDAARCFIQSSCRRNDDLWITTNIEDVSESLFINAIQMRLPLKDIYRRVSLTSSTK